MRIPGYTASPLATAALGLLLTAVYIVMSFGDTPYSPYVEFLFSSVPGLMLYLGLMINLMAWSIMTAIRRLGRKTVSSESIRQMDESVHLQADSGIKTLDEASDWFKRMGFRPRPSGEGIEASKGKFGIIPGIVLRTGIALMMLSALMSHHMRERDEAVLSQGGRLSVTLPTDLLGRKVYPVRIEAGLSDEYLDLGKASFSLDSISARMSVEGEEFTVTGGYPVRAAGFYWRVRHLGYSQPVDYGGHFSTVMLDVFPPGNASAHSLMIPDGQVYEFRLAPEKAITKGLITGDVFDLRTPRYELSPRGRKGGKVQVKAGGSAVIDGVQASFGQPGYYVMLQAVRDPALPLMRLAFYMAALGVLLMIGRLFWYERSMAAIMHEGRVLIGYREEFYRKWGIYKFRKWTGPLL